MSYTSGFFDAVDLGGGDYDREYSAAVFAHYFSLLVKNGVFPDPSTGMQVKASSNPDMHVSVQPGSGWVNGYYITVPDDAPEVLTVPTANPSLSRIDSVIMGLNFVDREIQLYIKSGAVSSSPSAVSLQRDSALYEMELAQITIAAGVASISQANITDMRQNTSRCGIVKGTIDQIDTTDLFAQYNDAFQTWFADIQAQLSGDVATNLQNQINGLKANKVNVSDKANTSQAQAGTDDTKWMTPKTTNVLVSSLINKVGDTLSTLRTDLGDKWLLCNGEDLDTNTYPELAKKITALNFSNFITEGYATGEIYSEAEDGGVYVQAGQITSTHGGAYKALLWYSTDPRGSTNGWKNCTLSEFFDGILTKVRVHNGTWVAVGYQRENLFPYVLTTTNPKGTWAVKQLLKTPCMLSGLVYAFNKWVAVGSVGSGQPKVFTATDPSGSWSDGVLSTTTNLTITNIAFNGTFLCAVGYDNSDVPYLVKNTSLSGTWETTRMTISNQPTSHPTIHPNSIAFSNGNWVVGCAVDEVNDYTWLARILVSSDLVTWTYKKIKSSDLTYVHAKYGAFVNFYNNKWYVTSSMERDQSYLCWTDNLGDSWSVKKLSSSGCCVKGADVANGYLFILGREYRSEKVGYYVVNKILPRISLNGVYTYIKAKE